MNDTDKHETTNLPGGDGILSAEVVAEPPPNASVVSSENETVRSTTYVIEVVHTAVDSENEYAEVTVPKEDVEQVSNRLSRLPVYVPESGSEYQHGYYISYRDEIVVVSFVVEE